jgi:hypothetical protein
MPKKGGLPRRILQDFAGMASFVVAGPSVAWVNEEAVAGGFRVFRAPIDPDAQGADGDALTTPIDAAIALASDGKRIFWAHEGVVGEAPHVAAPTDAR